MKENQSTRRGPHPRSDDRSIFPEETGGSRAEARFRTVGNNHESLERLGLRRQNHGINHPRIRGIGGEDEGGSRNGWLPFQVDRRTGIERRAGGFVDWLHRGRMKKRRKPRPSSVSAPASYLSSLLSPWPSHATRQRYTTYRLYTGRKRPTLYPPSSSPDSLQIRHVQDAPISP